MADRPVDALEGRPFGQLVSADALQQLFDRAAEGEC
jgi:hypothetical protein